MRDLVLKWIIPLCGPFNEREIHKNMSSILTEHPNIQIFICGSLYNAVSISDFDGWKRGYGKNGSESGILCVGSEEIHENPRSC
jgi:hypothetical protein